MLQLFSPDTRYETWRRLWVALARAEMKLGLPITQEQVSDLERELSSLMQQQVILESLYEGGIDLDYIETRAAELGLSVPTKDQTVYLNLSGSDKAEIYHAEDSSFIQRVIQAIESSASGLVEYLS